MDKVPCKTKKNQIIGLSNAKFLVKLNHNHRMDLVILHRRDTSRDSERIKQKQQTSNRTNHLIRRKLNSISLQADNS